MELFEAINSRSSVRSYSAEPVPYELLEKLVDAGRRAPSGRNVQPVEFVVLTKSDIKNKVALLTDYGKFLTEAPACIAVISRDTKYYLEDGCAAVENILLAATALGLGSCWIAGDKKPYAGKILELMGVPLDYKLVALIAIGYPAGETAPKPKRPLDEVLHREKF